MSSFPSSPPPTSSASGLILLQLSTRLVTFFLTQCLVRLSSPSVFGLANIHLDLLLSTVLFLSREGVRGGLLRVSADWVNPSSPRHHHQQQRAAQNVALLPVPLGILLSLLSSRLYISHLAPSHLSSHPHFCLSVHLYILGALLEILSEPLYTRAQSLSNVSLRIRAEGASVLLKCLATLSTIILASRSTAEAKEDVGLIAFGVGQAAYGATTLFVFLFHFLNTTGIKHTVALLTPSRQPLPLTNAETQAHGQPPVASSVTSSWLDQATLHLSLTLSKQSIVKHLLTEADKLAVAKLSVLEDQGSYALASNYGSLLARLLLQPLEESLRLSTSRQLSLSSIPSSHLSSSASHIQSLLTLYLYLFTFILIFCPPLVLPLLLLIAGPRWALQTRAPNLLAIYGSVLLPCMSLNGLLEGFLQSTADASTLSTYDAILVAASVVFGTSLWGFRRMGFGKGGEELVWANAANLLTRAIWGWGYMRGFFRRKMAEAVRREGQGAEKEKGEDEKATSKEEQEEVVVGSGKRSTSPSTLTVPLRPTSLLPSLPTLSIFLLSSALLNTSASSAIDVASLWARYEVRIAGGTGGGGRAATLHLLLSSPLREHIALGVTCLGACVGAW